MSKNILENARKAVMNVLPERSFGVISWSGPYSDYGPVILGAFVSREEATKFAIAHLKKLGGSGTKQLQQHGSLLFFLDLKNEHYESYYLTEVTKERERWVRDQLSYVEIRELTRDSVLYYLNLNRSVKRGLDK
jgi:hypothetical protein